MLVLIDEDVPNSVGQVFRDHGHEVRLVRDILGAGTPHPVIAKVANELRAILVTWNVRHFKRLSTRRNLSEFGLHRLGRIDFQCLETKGAHRAEQMMRRIEFEYEEAQRRQDKRIFIRTTETTFIVTI